MAVLKYWDGTQYVPVMGSTPEDGSPGPAGPPGPATYAQIATAAPTPRGVGDLWVDSSAPLLQWDDDWITPPLTGGWTNYGQGYAPARYRKLSSGQVEIQATITGGTLASPAFVLPAGYRPSASLILACTAGDLFGEYTVGADGNVTPLAGTGSFSLHHTFYAEQ